MTKTNEGWSSTDNKNIYPMSSSDVEWQDVDAFEVEHTEALFPAGRVKVPVYHDPNWPGMAFVSWADYQSAMGSPS